MEWIGMGFVLFLIGLSVFCVIKEKKTCELMLKRCKQESLVSLEIEKNKPRYTIRFVIQGDNVKKTKNFEPYMFEYSYTSGVETSETLARRTLLESIRNGFFVCEKDRVYPACNVISAWVEIV